MRKLRLVSIPVALLLLAAMPATTSAGKGAGVKKHEVDLTWKPNDQDLYPGAAVVVDSFDSSGPPFGDEVAETVTPRSQVGQNSRSGRWRLFVRPGAQGPNTGMCFGTYESDRNIIETTETSQTVEYGGILKLDGCKNTKKFKKAKPGKFGELQGETICTTTRCNGGLHIDGSIRY